MSKHKHCKHYYKLLSIIKEKDKEIAELKKRLHYYENYNSPPSANSLLWKKQKRERRAECGLNNAAERVLREVVIHRKIRGLLRDGKGMKMFGNIMTRVMTWKLRGMNLLEEVRKYL